jgi:proline iminopeptidase
MINKQTSWKLLVLICHYGISMPYPIESPRSQGYLQVSDKHQIFYATYGNPHGLPVIALHGGPGLGSSDAITRYFDLKRYNVVTFDQRGAMRSMPFACMEENTTQNSIQDIETLRNHLGIKQWVVFGSSWGSLLSILYGQAHPQSCLGFIIQDIFLGRSQDIKLFGSPDDMPEAYQEFIKHIPESEQNDLLTACYIRIINPDTTIHMTIARAFMKYHLLRTSGSINSEQELNAILANDKPILSAVRAIFHYAKHQLFIANNQALNDIHRIWHLPAIIIHGAIDRNCSSEQAKTLAQNWPNSQLVIVENAGHASSTMDSSIIAATDKFDTQNCK